MSKYQTLQTFRIQIRDGSAEFTKTDVLIWRSRWREHFTTIDAFSPWDAGIKARAKWTSLRHVDLRFTALGKVKKAKVSTAV